MEETSAAETGAEMAEHAGFDEGSDAGAGPRAGGPGGTASGGAATEGPAPGGFPDPAGEGVAGAVRDLVRTAVTSIGRAGTVSFAAVGDAVEAPGRALAGRIATAAVASPHPVAAKADLAAALEERSRSPLLGGSTGAALATKVASRVGPLRFLARRTPMWLVVTAVPALHASVTRGSHELTLVASHLVHRARAAGVEPDPERVRRVAVQLVSGVKVDPSVEPRHAPLAVAWLQRALRATLPFSGGVATRDPHGLARAAAAVDPSTLAV